MHEALQVHAPAGQTRRLLLMFHGVGSDAPALVPLGRLLAKAFPDDRILSVRSPFEGDMGGGRQWFSVRGVTEENRPARIAEVMPLFAQTVRALQAEHAVGAEATVLIGFSQGALMSLESARAQQGLAARIVSLAGRFAVLPEHALPGTNFHFIHGEDDPVIAAAHARAAVQRLHELGTPATLDVLPGTGHEITREMVQRLVRRLG